jgi:hypothetical protein
MTAVRFDPTSGEADALVLVLHCVDVSATAIPPLGRAAARRQPAVSASASEQNQRSPVPLSILVLE